MWPLDLSTMHVAAIISWRTFLFYRQIVIALLPKKWKCITNCGQILYIACPTTRFLLEIRAGPSLLKLYWIYDRRPSFMGASMDSSQNFNEHLHSYHTEISGQRTLYYLSKLEFVHKLDEISQMVKRRKILLIF